MKILIDGGSGLLGSELTYMLKNRHDLKILKGRKDADITDYHGLKKVIANFHPDVIIHCAGIKDIDFAEKNPSICYEVNVLGTKNMAVITGNLGIPIVHISSGSVYDGELGLPYTEFDKPHPVNVYGYSKLIAEENVKAYNRKHFILRLPLLFGIHGSKERNMIYSMKEKLAAGETLSYSVEQICNPTYCMDVAKVIDVMIDTDAFGTYNICNSGNASRYEFYTYIAMKLGYSNKSISPVSGDTNYAKREKNIEFNPIAFQSTFQFRMRDWHEAMDECIKPLVRGL